MEKQENQNGWMLPPELGIAIREMRESTPVMSAYPWSDMEIGDSVMFQAEQGETLESISADIETSMFQYSKFTGKKFLSKKIPSENGLRVWRRG